MHLSDQACKLAVSDQMSVRRSRTSRFPVWPEIVNRPLPSKRALAWENRKTRPALYLWKPVSPLRPDGGAACQACKFSWSWRITSGGSGSEICEPEVLEFCRKRSQGCDCPFDHVGTAIARPEGHVRYVSKRHFMTERDCPPPMRLPRSVASIAAFQ